MSITVWQIFGSECLGTALMIAVAVMVCGSRALPKTGAFSGDWINAALGWGLAVFIGVYAAWPTGGHLNPIVTIAKVFRWCLDSTTTLNGIPLQDGGIPVTLTTVLVYIVAQFVGAFVGAVVGFLSLRKHFDEPADPDVKLTIFCTKPPIKSPLWNITSEVICTTVLIIWINVNGGTPTQVGPLAVAFVIAVLVMGMGGVSGAAMNPARDLSPRLAHYILPIRGKGDSDWGYAWVPCIGPLIGAVLGIIIPWSLGLIV